MKGCGLRGAGADGALRFGGKWTIIYYYIVEEAGAVVPAGFEARMRALLGSEYAEFCAAFDRPLCAGLRRNPLKRGFAGDLARFSLAPVPWCPTGFYYDAASRPGLSPYHAAGLYYLQEPSAMAPAELLDPQPGARPVRGPRREIDPAGGKAAGAGAAGVQ